MLERTTRQIQAGIEAGLHNGAQVYVSRNGETVADFAVGEAHAGAALTSDHVLPWFSAGKPITAIAVAQQWEQNRLGLDDPVAQHIPDFAQHGKDTITVRHLLTHTAGIRAEPYRFPDDDWDTIIEKLCAMRMEPRWEPGKKAGYHALSSWWLLAEIVQRASGENISDYVRKHIFEPLGMNDSWLGMGEAQFDAYEQAGRWAPVYDMTKDPPVVRGSSERLHIVRAKPGGGAAGPMHELGRFYEMLLSGGALDGERLVKRETVEQFTAPHREGMHDHTFGQPITWGLGFIVDSKDQVSGVPAYGYGEHASPGTFGHSGVQSSAAFADPTHGLAVAIAFNGAPGEKAHQQRMHEALSALYVDVSASAASPHR